MRITTSVKYHLQFHMYMWSSVERKYKDETKYLEIHVIKMFLFFKNVNKCTIFCLKLVYL